MQQKINNKSQEIEKIRIRNKKRKISNVHKLYNPYNPSMYMSYQEKERKLIKKILNPFLSPANNMKILEVGCGAGYNLHILLGLGFKPENLYGNDILPDRIVQAQEFLPSKITLLIEDATSLPFPNSYFSAVYASTVFSSILDDDVQTTVSKEMWRLVKPGGG